MFDIMTIADRHMDEEEQERTERSPTRYPVPVSSSDDEMILRWLDLQNRVLWYLETGELQ